MTDNGSKTEKLIGEYIETYMEKIFYFCLKRTSNSAEAEDLAQDISLNVLASLNGGANPVCFSAWVWQIARNLYSVWAEKKHRRSEAVTGSDIGDCEMEDESGEITDQLIRGEQLSLLRRELAFIRSDYRDIIVAYYLKEKSVREIAKSLSLTENAVKQRLHRARKILKEGMDMAREFGTLSYRPENISFVFNGMNSSVGEPWNYLSRLLCKNILLAAYRTPATAEELAVEVGVALPYMEEELESMVSATLMKKNGNQYETNFFIVSAGAQEKITEHLRTVTPELTSAIIDALEFQVAWMNENCPGWHGGYQPYEDMKWALLMDETDSVDQLTRAAFRKDAKEHPQLGPWGHTIRPNGGEWDLLGKETVPSGDRPASVGLHGCISSPHERDLKEIDFRQFKFYYCGIADQTPNVLPYAEALALEQLAKGEGPIKPSLLQALADHGYVRKTDTGYEPAILVLYKDRRGEMPEDVREQLDSLHERAKQIATQHYLFCREQIYKEIPAFLREDDYQIDNACANIFMLRGAVLEEAIRRGYLSYDEKGPKRMLGAGLIV